MAQCISPYTKKNVKKGTNDTFPCGKCPECFARRISGWSFRLVKEGKTAKSSFFITFTYDSENIPISDNGYMTLKREHIQKFWKRYRKKYKTKISYYAVGEYGAKRGRPHFHAIVYNIKLTDLIGKKLAHQVEIGNIELDGKYEFNNIETWKFGHITIGRVEKASIGYVLKYMSKPQIIPMHKTDDRGKEFSNMSKGLGKGYLTPSMKKWHTEDLFNRMYIPIEDGKKIAMPRYYKNKIYEDWERKLISKHIERQDVENSKGKSEEDYKKEHSITLNKIRKDTKNLRLNPKL